ncbi:MAG: hypothetical protein KIT33_11270 [Candidatus Kapabacteria bacterium]|nr:hypothetical protein [Ignavibacteriota bacterium]MCW5885538.1 hypothetical protein [Candidatus Kapabacteria bacterium]
MKIVRKMMISCEKAISLSAKKSSHELDLIDSFKLKVHLMMCKNCKAFDEQISKIIEKLKIDSEAVSLTEEEKKIMISFLNAQK